MKSDRNQREDLCENCRAACSRQSPQLTLREWIDFYIILLYFRQCKLSSLCKKNLTYKAKNWVPLSTDWTPHISYSSNQKSLFTSTNFFCNHFCDSHRLSCDRILIKCGDIWCWNVGDKHAKGYQKQTLPQLFQIPWRLQSLPSSMQGHH